MDEILQAFAQTHDGVWAVDLEQRILLWNEAAEAMLGISRREALGTYCYRLLAGCDHQGKPLCRPDCRVMERVKQGRLLGNSYLQVNPAGHPPTVINVSVVVPLKREERSPRVVVALFRPAAGLAAGPPTLKIRLLGPIAADRADGSPVEGVLWQRGKVRALLAFLALHCGRPVHRDLVIEALWPDLTHDRALHNLNTTVYYLRRCLEPGLKRGSSSSYIKVVGDDYVLSAGHAFWLDVKAFETGIERARREPDPQRAIALYREALALYRGPFVADLEADLLDCWMERERLSQFYLNAVAELAALCARQQQNIEAKELYLRVLATDPCRETVTQQLMFLALREGDRPAALAHYHRLEQALWRDLEMGPSPEIRLLADMALHGGREPVTAPSVGSLEALLRVG